MSRKKIRRRVSDDGDYGVSPETEHTADGPLSSDDEELLLVHRRNRRVVGSGVSTGGDDRGKILIYMYDVLCCDFFRFMCLSLRFRVKVMQFSCSILATGLGGLHVGGWVAFCFFFSNCRA